MQPRWTEEAANDLERIADCLLLNAPDLTDLVKMWDFKAVVKPYAPR